MPTHDPAYEQQRATAPLDTGQYDRRRPPGGGPNAGVVTPHGRPGVYIYPFWQRSEFWAFVLTALAVGIGAAAADSFDAKGAWQLIAGLAAAYILSRGFAKREPRDDDDDRPWTPGSGAGGGDRPRYDS